LRTLSHAVPGKVIGTAAAKAIAAGVATAEQAGARDTPLQESERHLPHEWRLGEAGKMSGGSTNRDRAFSARSCAKNNRMFKIAPLLI